MNHIHKYIGQSIFILFILFVSSILSITKADTVDVNILNLTVLDEDYHEYSIGERFKLNVDKSSIIDVGGLKKIRFRIFSGTAEQIMNRGFKTSDNCYIFISKSYKAEDLNGSLKFSFRFSENWLGYNNKDRLVDKTYLIVFEEFNDTDDYIKLHPSQVESYFRSGYHFIVKSSDKISADKIAHVIERKMIKTNSISFRLQQINENIKVSTECSRYNRVLLAKNNNGEGKIRICSIKNDDSNNS